MTATNHHRYMSHALELASQGRTTVSPNPMVGCVIVKGDCIVGEGYHQRAGDHHAEIYALNKAKSHANGATVYVTLEPCSHQGKTPPCTKALIKAGVKKIYVAVEDPNPLVLGQGIAALRAAGIEVLVGLCAEEALKLNEVFFHYIRKKRPFVILKWAMSLDGKTIVNHEDTKKISGDVSHCHTHQIRSEVDAIIIGARTAVQDNPRLTARSNEKQNLKQPIRIVLSSQGNLPPNLTIFDSHLPGKTILATTLAINKKFYQLMKEKNIEVLILPETTNHQVHLPSLLDELGKKALTSVLVEGGRQVHESFLQYQLANKIQVYLAPVIIGSLEKKQAVSLQKSAALASDFYFEGNI